MTINTMQDRSGYGLQLNIQHLDRALTKISSLKTIKSGYYRKGFWMTIPNNFSPKKNSIASLDEYYRLDAIYHDAYDRLQYGNSGTGYGGIHFDVMNELTKYGLIANSRQEAVALLEQLLEEYEKTQLDSNTAQSDEEYLRKFEDIENL